MRSGVGPRRPGAVANLGGASAVVESVRADVVGPAYAHPTPSTRRWRLATRAAMLAAHEHASNAARSLSVVRLRVKACDHGFKGGGHDCRPIGSISYPPSTRRRTPPAIRSDRPGLSATSPRPNLPDPVDDALQRSVPMTVITRSPDAKRRNAPDTTPTIASSSSSSTSWEPLSQASQPQSGIHVITTAGSPTPSVTPASSTGPRLAASDDQREPTDDVRHEAISAGHHGARRCLPADRRVAFHLREAGRSEGDHPGIGAGADDPPLGRIRQPRVLLLAWPSVRMWVGPGREATAGDGERLVDGVEELLLVDHARHDGRCVRTMSDEFGPRPTSNR